MNPVHGDASRNRGMVQLKLVNYISGGSGHCGLVAPEGVREVHIGGSDGPLSPSSAAILHGIVTGKRGIGEMEYPAAPPVDETSLKLLPCITNPGRVLCVGLNYRRHAAESGMPVPEFPVVFGKFSDCVAASGDPVPIPPGSSMVDYEAELGIMIGSDAFRVPEQDALDSVLGYFCANDVSARDFQLRTSQWLLGKTCENFCPVGPYMVTADEVPDPDSLRIGASLNGRPVQDSSTGDMIFSCASIVSFISGHIRLHPGDIILTGTPEGVILGKPEGERAWLRHGDSVSVTIEGLGTLSNEFV